MHPMPHIVENIQIKFKIMVRTIDTDIVVLMVSKMANIDANEVWIAFGTGKQFRYLAIHDIAA